MANHKKEPIRYTVHAEPITDENRRAIVDVLLTAYFRMTHSEIIQEIKKNAGGRYDYLHGKGTQTLEEMVELMRGKKS